MVATSAHKSGTCRNYSWQVEPPMSHRLSGPQTVKIAELILCDCPQPGPKTEARLPPKLVEVVGQCLHHRLRYIFGVRLG